MHCSMVITLKHYAYNYSASMLCTEASIGISKYYNSTFPLHISKHHLVQDLSMRLANNSRAWTHECKNGIYCYFTCLNPMVISNSNTSME